MLKGVCKAKGEVLFEVEHAVQPGGKASDAVVAVRQKVTAGLNAYIAAHSLRDDEVDVMEEDAGEDDPEGTGGGAAAGGGQAASKRGKKRKQPPA